MLSILRVQTPQEGRMFYRQEIQSQHAEATRKGVLCGELGTRRDVSEK